MRQLSDAELNFHMTSVRDSLGIFHRFPCIGEESLHLLLAFDVVLSPFVTHSVFIRNLFAGLETEQNIMGIRVRRICIMDIIGGDQGDIQLFTHFQQFRIYKPLFRQPVILQFQKIVPFAETGLVLFRRFPRFLRQSLGDIPLHLPRQTCGQSNNPLMVLV